MWISHIEIYSKKGEVTELMFPLFNFMCPRTFTADTNDYSLVTSLMPIKDAHKCARALPCWKYLQYFPCNTVLSLFQPSHTTVHNFIPQEHNMGFN